MMTVTPAPSIAGRQPPMSDGEGCEPEIGLGLAAAGGEEQQVHGLAIWVGLVDEASQIEQDEGELEWAPLGRRLRPWDRRLGQHSFAVAAAATASFMKRKARRACSSLPSSAMPSAMRLQRLHAGEELVGGLLARALQRGGEGVLTLNPIAIEVGQRRRGRT